LSRRSLSGDDAAVGCGQQEEVERPEGSVMSTQLRLPAAWALSESRADPRSRLESLRADTVEAKAKIREVLDTLAIKHDIAVKDVTYAMAYADDMLADTIYNVERGLEREIEGEEPV
jgi:hypothetical protein